MDSVLALLDRLEVLCTRGSAAERKTEDLQEILGLLRMVRARLPADLHHAQRLGEEAEMLHRRATDEARRILLEAETHARRLVDEAPIGGETERRRARVLQQAEADAERIRREADEYAGRVLADLEAEVVRILGAVQRGKSIRGAPR